METSALIYVNATESIRAGNLECSNVDGGGEKYRGVPHAELKWIVNHRRTMPSVCLESSGILEDPPIPHIYIIHYFCILPRFNFYLHFTSLLRISFFPFFSWLVILFFSLVFNICVRINYFRRATMKNASCGNEHYPRNVFVLSL